jgi:hypothetical protein
MTTPSGNVCLRCGYASSGPAAFCRRCGLPFGAAPQVEALDGPGECPVCYARADRSGLFPAPGGGRTSYERHAYDHEVRPVGDDDWLETLLSAYIEDTWIHHIVFFRWHGDWIGLLEGAGQKTGRALRAYFDFTRNTIVFPVSRDLDALGSGFVPVAAAVR